MVHDSELGITYSYKYCYRVTATYGVLRLIQVFVESIRIKCSDALHTLYTCGKAGQHHGKCTEHMTDI